MMTAEQRVLYPGLLRRARFDSIVVGNSTSMLIDPMRLSDLLGGRFANLAIADGYPWEQQWIVRLFLRETPRPKTIVFGIGWTWCVENDEPLPNQIERFPTWLYQEFDWRDLGKILNRDHLRHARRSVVGYVRSKEPALRDDGYWDFTGGDQYYVLDTALTKIWPHGRTETGPVVPPAAVPPDAVGSWRFPAVERFERLISEIPDAVKLVFAAMPVHAVAQPRPGSIEAAREDACKLRIARLAGSRGTVLVDFRRRSPVTTNDENYWDHLHYRQRIARRIEDALASVLANPRDDPSGFWRVLPPTRPGAPPGPDLLKPRDP